MAPLPLGRVYDAAIVTLHCPVESVTRINQRSAAMLRSRAEISQDKYFGKLTDAILARDQPRTTDLFFQMVAKDGRSIGDALAVVTAAEAPFVQVPSHIN